MRSKRTAAFKRQLEALPEKIQDEAAHLFELFEKNPRDPLLQTKSLNDSSKGRHRKSSFSVRITYRYRAVYVIDNGKNGDEPKQCCWYWVGSREEFANFVRCT